MFEFEVVFFYEVSGDPERHEITRVCKASANPPGTNDKERWTTDVQCYLCSRDKCSGRKIKVTMYSFKRVPEKERRNENG